MSTTGRRGIFVVFEGVDRSGKSTQCRLLVESLQARGRSAELAQFPDRSTEIGSMINRYLKRKNEFLLFARRSCRCAGEIELDDRAVHLLFSANRWEQASLLRSKLVRVCVSTMLTAVSQARGVDIVCDRYAYSGVAFSAAKESIADIEWCKAPDAGLPEPDLVIFLRLDQSAAETRGGYGGERYEVTDLQRRVANNFDKLRADAPSRWRQIDASRDIDNVRRDVERFVQSAIDLAATTEVSSLWSDSPI